MFGNSWNSPKSLWGIETSTTDGDERIDLSSWNSPKSLWGIETRHRSLLPWRQVEIHQNPFEGLKPSDMSFHSFDALVEIHQNPFEGLKLSRSRRGWRWEARVEIHQNPFEGLKPEPERYPPKLFLSWNSPKSLWGIETKKRRARLVKYRSWNSPKSLWGIETVRVVGVPTVRAKLKFTKIPLRDWNS